jgi:hypothetical protein
MGLTRIHACSSNTNNIPEVISTKGTFFVFVILFYDVTSDRNRMKQMARRTMTIIYVDTAEIRCSEMLLISLAAYLAHFLYHYRSGLR